MTVTNPARYNSDGTVTIHDTCILCGLLSSVTVPLDGYRAWRMGNLVQDAFPDLPAGDRETLISGIHGDCFDGHFRDKQ